MADSTDTSIDVQASTGAATKVTEYLRAASPATIYARDAATSTPAGLTWGYMGGRWDGNSIASGTQAIGASTTTYMVVARATGAVSFSTSNTNWNNATDYARAYLITSGASAVTGYEDHRAGAKGTQGGSGGGGGGSGDVVGPSASIANEVALFDGTTGKLIKRATSTGTPYLTSGVLSINKVTLTQPATGSTLTILDGKTATFNHSMTFAGTDGQTYTFPPASASVGYLNIPQNSQSTAYTTVLADAGKHLLHPSADTTARTFTIDSNANVAYPVGTAITFVNQNSAGVMTIAITSDTMRLAGAGTTGSRTLAANGIATALKVTSTEWIISGTGLT